MCDADLVLALQLQEQFDREMAENSMSIVDESWELTDPNPNVHALFLEFNATFFWGKLDCVEVKWSPRMTLCAGLCCYEGRGGLCCIKLSLPLLKLRPRKDLVETLLHEMIHALLFVTHNNKDHDAHGPEFLKHMKRINNQAGTNISVYHNFHDEVDVYRQHWWRCDGPCQKWKPYFGIVRRAMNRAPSARDPWWADHQRKCGGTYTKIKEPEGYSNKKAGKRKKGQDTGAVEGAAPSKKQASATSTNYGNIELFAGKGFVLGTKSGSSTANKGLNSTQRFPSASASASSAHKTAISNQSTASSPPGLPSLSGSKKTSTDRTLPQTTSVLSARFDNAINGYQNSGHKGKPVTKHTLTKDGANSLHRPSARQTSGLHGSSQSGSGIKNSVGHSSVESDVHTEALVSCPVCGGQLPVATINQHLDSCLNN
uniref:DNA-dependent metalloprotease SPRTN n=1 Tax=Branchiostoma floridae TaxID=7739 RepID=C3XZD0_BRAFL|eukprot:XP_002610684.1 hypothetical protein BRAFLDRAFT_65890 [Branchiostoma floridae]